MEVLKTLLPLAITSSLTALVLGMGLDADPADSLYLLRRPRKLLGAVLAISLVVPAVTLVLIRFLPLAPEAKLGIALMAVAPVPPFVPLSAIKAGGGKSYVHGLFVAYAVLSVAIVPATIAFLARAYRIDIWISPLAVGRTMLFGVLGPLAIGMAVKAWRPRLAARCAPIVSRIAIVLLLLSLVPVLIVAFPGIRAASGDGSVLAIAIIILAAIAAAHQLGGHDTGERAALAAAAATRHPGIALLIAHANGLDRQVDAVVLLFALEALVIFSIYRAATKRAESAAKARTIPAPR